MRIRKWYEVSCDYCRAAIGHYLGDTVKEVVEQVKDTEHGVVQYYVGKRRPYIFCNDECRVNWEKENERKR